MLVSVARGPRGHQSYPYVLFIVLVHDVNGLLHITEHQIAMAVIGLVVQSVRLRVSLRQGELAEMFKLT